ncbi:MAG: PilZ domain-containing protein [Pseudomonadota bacterium]
MDKENNRRTSFRMPFVSKMDCRAKGSEKIHAGALRDVSINGLFADMDEYPPDGAECVVHIYFEGDHSRLVIENLNGKIVRSDPGGVAIKFDKRLEWFVLIPLFFYQISGKTKIDGISPDFDYLTTGGLTT